MEYWNDRIIGFSKRGIDFQAINADATPSFLVLESFRDLWCDLANAIYHLLVPTRVGTPREYWTMLSFTKGPLGNWRPEWHIVVFILEIEGILSIHPLTTRDSMIIHLYYLN